MRRFFEYDEFNVLQEEYLINGNIDALFYQYDEFEYLRYLYNYFKLAKKRIYLFDNDISLSIIYLLKNVSSDVQVTIFTNNHHLYKNDVNYFLKKYSNVNLVFRKNKFKEKYIVIDYNESDERIIVNNTIVFNDGIYHVLEECRHNNYYEIFKKCENADIFLLK